jgi:hypothetical protein
MKYKADTNDKDSLRTVVIITADNDESLIIIDHTMMTSHLTYLLKSYDVTVLFDKHGVVLSEQLSKIAVNHVLEYHVRALTSVWQSEIGICQLELYVLVFNKTIYYAWTRTKTVIKC